jgi:dTDP-glucose 4,6-dehydratase
MKVLITGGLGFIGSNFYNYIIQKYKDYEVHIIDSVTYAANYNNVKNLDNDKFYKVSITDRDKVFEIFNQHKFDFVVNFAAESHVDNSIFNPLEFAQTNIIGTINLLDASVKNNVKLFYHISTDEVFGHLGPTGEFYENTPYNPRSPYSASKASSDHFVRAYHNTYNLPIIISNCSNNYGPNQHEEKLIPTVIKNVLKGTPIPIYGNGMNVRDWLYVEDHVKAIDKILHKGKVGETYCVGGGFELSNLRLTQMICDKLDVIMDWNKTSRDQITFVTDRKGHDFRYSIDSSKLKNGLDWKPEVTIEDGLHNTINFYLEKFKVFLES